MNFSLELQKIILDGLTEGKTLKSIANENHFQVGDFLYFARKNTSFSLELNEARKMGAWARLEKSEDDFTNAIDYLDVAKADKQAAHRRWLASKHHREVYGDKVDVNVNQKVDLSGVLNAAKNRLSSIQGLQNTSTEEKPAIAATYKIITTGHEPVDESTQPSDKAESFEDLL